MKDVSGVLRLGAAVDERMDRLHGHLVVTLDRALKQSVVIQLEDGRRVRVTVLPDWQGTHEGYVRVGIEAPRSVPIVRKELV